MPHPMTTAGERRPFRLPTTPAAVSLLALAILAGVWNYLAAQSSQAEAKRQRTLVARSDHLLSTMKDLEIGERGYALTGRSEYLDPYNAALPRIERELGKVDAADPSFATETARALRPLRALVIEEEAFFARVIATRRADGSEAATALVSTGQGRRLMEAIEAAKGDADARAGAETARIEEADSARSLALNLVLFLAAGSAVALLLRLSLLRRRESQGSRRTLEDVLGNAPVGLGFLDRNLDLRHMNRAFTALGEGGLRARVGRALWAEHPEMEDRLRPSLEAALDRGSVVKDVDVVVSDPSASGGTRHLRMAFYPLKDWNGPGDGGGVGIAVVDLTEARQSEARIRAGQAVLRAVLDTLPVGVLIAEAPSGRITDHNACAEEILGHGVMPSRSGGGPARWVGFHEDGRPVAPGDWPLVRVVRDGEPMAELEVDYQRGDGRRAWVDFTGAPMRDASGVLTGGVVVVADIDARKRSERALAAARDAAEAASRAKSTFLANMSHELRTPLSAIIGYSEMMAEEIADGCEVADLAPDMAKVEGNARHLLGLINDVLDLSKIESGKMEVNAEPFDVEPMLHDVVGSVGTLVDRRANRLELHVDGDLGAMRSDPVKLRQSLLNLIGNAAKFTESGVITLSASRVRGDDGAAWLSFAVADTGIGMTAEQVSRLFQRFSQADASTTRRFGGTGLGLALTKAFADMLGGRIAVDSVSGFGSTFTLAVPADHRDIEDRAPAEMRAGDTGECGA